MNYARDSHYCHTIFLRYDIFNLVQIFKKICQKVLTFPQYKSFQFSFYGSCKKEYYF